MSKDKDSLLVEEIVEAISWIKTFLGGISRNEFLDNELVSCAVMYKIQSIGEAAKRLSPGFRARYKGILWKQIAGMRDILVHDYTQVDRGAVWQAATNDIPALKEHLTKN